MFRDCSALRCGSSRCGYTLVEVLVAVGIMAVLIGLLAAGVQKVRGAAARSACQNNLRQVGLAVQQFHDLKKSLPPNGYLSPVYDAPGRPESPRLPDGRPGSPPPGSFLFHVLPALGEEAAAVWRQPAAADPTDAMIRVQGTAMQTYKCPSRGSPLVADVPAGPPWDSANTLAATDGSSRRVSRHGLGDYAVNEWLYVRLRGDGVDGVALPQFRGVTDGLSNTVLAAEKVRGAWVEPRTPYGYCCPWTDGGDAKFAPSPDGPCGGLMTDARYTAIRNGQVDPAGCGDMVEGAGSAHPGGVAVAACDGSVRLVGFNIRPSVWAALCTPAGGESAAFPD